MSDWWWPSLVLSRKIISLRSKDCIYVWLMMGLSCPFKEDHLALPLSTPLFSKRLMVWCPWLCVSSFSTLEISWEASHLWWLLCLPVYLLRPFPSLWQVQGSTPTGVFKGFVPVGIVSGSSTLRFSEMQATCGGCFAHQSVCSVISHALR